MVSEIAYKIIGQLKGTIRSKASHGYQTRVLTCKLVTSLRSYTPELTRKQTRLLTRKLVTSLRSYTPELTRKQTRL